MSVSLGIRGSLSAVEELGGGKRKKASIAHEDEGSSQIVILSI
jgi:hypothetical protein